MKRPLRIAQVAPPLERVPPLAYGGTERIVFELVVELERRGHDVTLFASGDSEVPCELVPTVPEALRPAGFGGDAAPYFYQSVLEVVRRDGAFDLIHSHLEWASVVLMAASRTPVVATFHGRLDFPFARRLLDEAPGTLVAISESQAGAHPDLPWNVVYNGLRLESAPFERRRGEGLCFVGRVNREKGILEAMEVARIAERPLRIAAKVGASAEDRSYFEDVFLPAVEQRPDVEYLGELGASDRDRLYSESYATLMPGTWPEPFGLTAIESLACGTPVIARRVGALPEIVRHGQDGFLADDIQNMAFVLDQTANLDRAEIRASVIERFSTARMVDRYLAVYDSALASQGELMEGSSGSVTSLSTARAATGRGAAGR